jgi:hypothetical protein
MQPDTQGTRGSLELARSLHLDSCPHGKGLHPKIHCDLCLALAFDAARADERAKLKQKAGEAHERERQERMSGLSELWSEGWPRRVLWGVGPKVRAMKAAMSRLCYDCGLKIIDSQDSEIDFVEMDGKQVSAMKICFNFAEDKREL